MSRIAWRWLPWLGLVGVAVAQYLLFGSPSIRSQDVGGSRTFFSGVADKDCADFKTHAEAQAFFLAQGPGDPHRLDADGDGLACEWLP